MSKPKALPPIETLNELLIYKPESGKLYWKISRGNGTKAGDEAGSIKKDGYVQVSISDVSYKAHRVAWLMHTGEDPGEKQIDHKDGNRANNQINNLRLADNAENSRNSRRQRNNKSGLKGACFHRQHKKWSSQIMYNKKIYFLGLFDTPELAHAAYCKAALKLHGEFARTS